MNWLWNNKQWVFDGFGVVVVASIIGWVVRKFTPKQKQENFSEQTFRFVKVKTSAIHLHEGEYFTISSPLETKVTLVKLVQTTNIYTKKVELAAKIKIDKYFGICSGKNVQRTENGEFILPLEHNPIISSPTMCDINCSLSSLHGFTLKIKHINDKASSAEFELVEIKGDKHSLFLPGF